VIAGTVAVIALGDVAVSIVASLVSIAIGKARPIA